MSDQIPDQIGIDDLRRFLLESRLHVPPCDVIPPVDFGAFTGAPEDLLLTVLVLLANAEQQANASQIMLLIYHLLGQVKISFEQQIAEAKADGSFLEAEFAQRAANSVMLAAKAIEPLTMHMVDIVVAMRTSQLYDSGTLGDLTSDQITSRILVSDGLLHSLQLPREAVDDFVSHIHPTDPSS
jgi:hypothetical protein